MNLVKIFQDPTKIKETITNTFLIIGVKIMRFETKKVQSKRRIIEPKPLIIIGTFTCNEHVTFSGRIIGPDKTTQAKWYDTTSPLVKKYCRI